MRYREQIFRAVALMLPVLQLAAAINLSPGHWRPADRNRVEELEMRLFPSQARTIEGPSGLISNTGSPIAVHAGMEALKQGGTAADAAATVALTQIAVVLGSYVSYAGALHLLYYEAKTRRVYSLDAGWNSYSGEVNPGTIPVTDLQAIGGKRPATNGAQGRKTLVPGFMAGIEAMHKRFGRLPFDQLFQPAIWYAENGVTVTPAMSAMFGLQGKSLLGTPEGGRFLQQAGDDLPKTGDRFMQTELGKTLRGVAEQGARHMYTGPWGRQFVKAVRREGGNVTIEDMKNYRPAWEEPLSTNFDHATVVVPGKSNEAAHQVLEAINLVEELHLDQKGPYWKNPSVFRDLSKVLQLVEIRPYTTPEVAEYMRKKGLAFSPDDRITKPYAKAMAPMIAEPESTGRSPQSPHHSAGTVVIDQWGNVAAIVHTIEDLPWGSTGIVVAGIPLSGVAGTQQAQLSAIRPGSRLPGLAAPLMAMAGDKPFLALATVGTSLVPETARLLLSIIGNHLDAKTAIAAPALLYNFEPPGPGETYSWKLQFAPEGAYDVKFLDGLSALGVKLEGKPKWQVQALRGTAALATIDPRTGILSSVEDPATINFADGY